MLHGFIRARVGNGKDVRFWLDVWQDGGVLKHRWPALYGLETEKNCLVSDRLRLENQRICFAAEWVNKINSIDAFQEWLQLLGWMDQVALTSSKDVWTWVGDKDGIYSTFSVRKCMQKDVAVPDFVLKWIRWVPIKCHIMVWRAEMGRIPTKLELVKRKMTLPDTLCPWCEMEEESVMHSLVGCLVASAVWDAIGRWLGIPPIFAFELRDLLEVYKTVGGDKLKRKLVQGIVMVTLWALWYARNDLVFNGKKPLGPDIIARIKSLSADFTLISKPNYEHQFSKRSSKTPFLKNKEYAWNLLGKSCKNSSMWKNQRTTTFVTHSNINPPPEAAPLPSGSPSGSLRNWIVGIVLTFVLPFITHKWGPLLLLKTDKVIDSITDNLPKGSQLKKNLEFVDEIVEGVAKSAHVADKFINEVEEAEDKLESLITHENSKGDKVDKKLETTEHVVKAIENIAEKADKVEEAEDKLESLITHENSKGGEIPKEDEDTEDQEITEQPENNKNIK
ncbi:hypothetical protein M8C21_007761 [Ambrosia artemisiifolia]|uniref:Reverse transcriptase zinc-binding domain-containing protein n=1 Tax=Ambrosia artemisiifolia TaxID=4212 RepID=A0AAD5CL13_AMBAR|nr:hypothetical protein M8C21_007761 [Ambrosia artemisiifolia]